MYGYFPFFYIHVVFCCSTLKDDLALSIGFLVVFWNPFFSALFFTTVPI